MNQKRRNWVIILIVLTFIVILRTTSAPTLHETAYFDMRQPAVIAHQGGNLLRPGNTLISFAHAVSLGVEVLEMDVHGTADGVVVVIHDATVDRTTNGSGAVSDLSLESLKTLDAAFHWPFTGEEHPYRDRGVRVPTLDEVLTRFPHLRFNIEIKQEEPSIAEALCAALREHGVESRTLVASFLRGAMLEFREACPSVATSAFSAESTVFVAHAKLGLAGIYMPQAHAVQLPKERYGVDLHTASVISAAQERGMRFDAWTVNSEEQMRALFALGVDGLITDRPDLALKVRNGE